MEGPQIKIVLVVSGLDIHKLIVNKNIYHTLEL